MFEKVWKRLHLLGKGSRCLPCPAGLGGPSAAPLTLPGTVDAVDEAARYDLVGLFVAKSDGGYHPRGRTDADPPDREAMD